MVGFCVADTNTVCQDLDNATSCSLQVGASRRPPRLGRRWRVVSTSVQNRQVRSAQDDECGPGGSGEAEVDSNSWQLGGFVKLTINYLTKTHIC